MPTINIESNIKQIRESIERATQEICRLQGVLQTFEGFRNSGLENIELPNPPSQTSVDDIEELESVQEKPE